MKTASIAFILLSIQTAFAGYDTIIEPSQPLAGDNITITTWVFCPQNAITLNLDENQFTLDIQSHHINLTSFYEQQVGCIMAPPVPISFEIGQLAEGAYDLDISFQALDNMLPVGNTEPGSSISFQVGPAPAGGSIQPVNTLSQATLFLLLILVFSSAIMTSKKAFK